MIRYRWVCCRSRRLPNWWPDRHRWNDGLLDCGRSCRDSLLNLNYLCWWEALHFIPQSYMPHVLGSFRCSFRDGELQATLSNNLGSVPSQLQNQVKIVLILLLCGWWLFSEDVSGKCAASNRLCKNWGIFFPCDPKEVCWCFFHSWLNRWRAHWKGQLVGRYSYQQKNCFGSDLRFPVVQNEDRLVSHFPSYQFSPEESQGYLFHSFSRPRLSYQRKQQRKFFCGLSALRSQLHLPKKYYRIFYLRPLR